MWLLFQSKVENFSFFGNHLFESDFFSLIFLLLATFLVGRSEYTLGKIKAVWELITPIHRTEATSMITKDYFIL